MKGVKFGISPAAAVLYSFIYYITDTKSFFALLVPVLIHELGHLICLRAFGLRVNNFRIELKGLCIAYSGRASGMAHMLAALSGPAAGLLYAWFAAAAGKRFGMAGVSMSAGISLVLSLFNLVPAMPLDGGRAAEKLMQALCGVRRAEAVCRWLTLLSSAAFLTMGFSIMVSGRGAGLLIAAIWLLLSQETVVKTREVL